MAHPIFSLDPAGYRAHALHDSGRHWPQTNCYVDLWIEVLASLGHAPEAMLGFTVAQDFEGDQFTFFKVPLEDLERLYGLRVTELSIFDTVEAHARTQLDQGRLVLVEVDGYYLPDTRGVSYRTTHPKTTVAINAIDPAARRMTYFHNAGYFALEGEDYDGIFGVPGAERDPALLLPYVEFVKIGEGEAAGDPAQAARDLLAHHLARRPAHNPIRAYGRALPAHLADLAGRPPDYFHLYAFNTLRQLGANFELLGAHLAWLAGSGMAGLCRAEAAALRIAEGAKTMQFKLARAVARRRFDGVEGLVEPMADAYDEAIAALREAMDAMGGRTRQAA